MPWEAFKREVLDYYVSMASDPAWKAQAWHQVNEFASQHPSEFGDLPEMLKQAMLQRKKDATA